MKSQDRGDGAGRSLVRAERAEASPKEARERRQEYGDFDAEMQRLRATLENDPDSFYSEFAQAQLGYLTMRRGDLTEAARIFHDVVASCGSPHFVRYAEIMGAACDCLRGSPSDVELGETVQGAQVGYCVLAAWHGDYIADHLPEVRDVIQSLGLSEAKLTRARLKR